MNNFKQICKKIADFIQIVFGYGMFICLFVGGLSFFGYLFALIVGGKMAADVCTFIYKTLYPYLVRLSSVMILLGIVKIYLVGEVALSGDTKKK